MRSIRAVRAKLRAYRDGADMIPNQLRSIQRLQKQPPPAKTVLRMVGVLCLTGDEAADFLEVVGYSLQLLIDDYWGTAAGVAPGAH